MTKPVLLRELVREALGPSKAARKAPGLYDFFGLPPASLTVAVSWTGGGATRPMAALLTHLAVHEARREKVLLACHRPVVDYARLCLAQAAGGKGKLARAGKAHLASNLILWDVRREDPAEFNVRVRRLAEEGLKLLIVDSLRDLGWEWKQRDKAQWLSELAEECQMSVVVGMELPPPIEERPWGAVRPRLADLPEEVLHHTDAIVTLHPKVHRRAKQMRETMVLETIQDPVGRLSRMELEYHRPSGRLRPEGKAPTPDNTDDAGSPLKPRRKTREDREE